MNSIKRISLTCAMAFAASGLAAASPQPTDGDRRDFAGGVASMQLIDVLQDPRACGIVALRKHCAEILPTGAPPALVKFASTGDSVLYDKTWGDANDMLVAESDWRSQPRPAWLRLAGIAWEASFNPFRPTFIDALKYGQLALHASEAGPYADLVPHDFAVTAARTFGATPSSIPLSVEKADALKKVLLPQLQELFATEAQPAIVVDEGIRGDRQLGVYVATANEMFESPTLFTQPQSRAFLAALVLRLAPNQPDAQRDALARSLSQRFLTIEGSEAWTSAHADFTQIAPFRPPLSEHRRFAFIYGTMAAQTAYNAAVLRETAALNNQLSALGHLASSEQDVAILGEKRRALQAVDPHDWIAVNAAATALTLTILQDVPTRANS